MRRAAAALAAAAAALLLAACGEKDEPTISGTPALTVSAAASLQEALNRFDQGFSQAAVRAQFAGSDELAAQIEQGVAPDLYLAASTSLPDQLHAKGLVDAPEVFASNALVLAVPADGAKVGGLPDLRKDGIRIAIGSATVPVGSYTREVLGRLPDDQEKAIMANVRSEEPDVKGVVGKLTQGAVDAGFVYATDVHAAGGRLKAISLPQKLQPNVAYGGAVVTGAEQPVLARAYLRSLISGRGQTELRRAGFLPPP